MSERFKEYDMPLIQRDASKEKLLDKMRGKLASAPAAPYPGTASTLRRRKADRGQVMTWGVRIAMVGLIAVINWLLIDRKDQILAGLGYEGVPALPRPTGNLSPDDRALYYAYALYDYDKFQARFGMNGFYAIDQAGVRAKLDDLLPKISTATLGEISGYAPVAFKTISAGAAK